MNRQKILVMMRCGIGSTLNRKAHPALLLLNVALFVVGSVIAQKHTLHASKKVADNPNELELLKKELEEDAHKDYYKFVSCNVSVSISPMPRVLKLITKSGELMDPDKQPNCVVQTVKFNIENHGRDTCFFANLFGRLSDQALITLQLYKKKDDKYLLVEDKQNYICGGVSYFEVSLLPGKSRSELLYLNSLFIIDTQGEYKIGGVYKTNCICTPELHKMNEVFFRVQ